MTSRVRLDVFLDVACLAKTRSQAKNLCDGGKVEVNGERAKPHRLVGPGDRIRLTMGPGRRREVIVREVRETHVSKAEAKTLYEDVTPPLSPEELALLRAAPAPAPPKGKGRPEKRDRRLLEKLRGRR
ncbi:MAG: RNA-binding S4 domain-containing protein [Thermoanaerobaculum sp.]